MEKAPHLDGLSDLRTKAETQRGNAESMESTIAGYCWDATTIKDLQIAPFHLLVGEGRVFNDKSHIWHMETITKLCEAAPILTTTGWRQFNGADEKDCAAVTDWWLSHTEVGGEGMVIKPNAFLLRGEKAFVQPAMKVRGRDYLRIIYGPDYDLPENVERLRRRGLGRKFSLAERELKLGLEGLHRFVERQPLSKVHMCALATLALESEPVDPRL